MRKTSVTCDRCREPIAEGVSVMSVTIPAGGLAATLHEPIDVCRGCADAFLAWLRAKPAAEGGEPIIDDQP